MSFNDGVLFLTGCQIMNKKWIVFIRKEYLLIFLAVVACAFTRANAASQIMPSCQGVNVIASCRASRQSLSGSTQVWNVADGQWLIFSSMKNDTSGGHIVSTRRNRDDAV